MTVLRRVLMILMVGVLVVSGQAPARATTPGDISRLTVQGSTRTSLTLAWRAADGAEAYVVESASGLEMSARRVVARTQGRRITVTGLRPGALYCFQVRGVDGRNVGDRSRKACQRTIAQEGDASGPVYRVLTYNICSRVCPQWHHRKPHAAALVRAQQPDVVALTEAVEDSGMAAAIGGMTQVVARSGKALLFRRDRFTVAHAGGSPRTGSLVLWEDRDSGVGRYAVWAELVDRATGQHVIFLSVHLSPHGDGAEADRQRRRETIALVKGMERINPANRPIVLAGDFNSYAQREYDSPGDVLTEAGLANAFWRAHRWVRGTLNSGNKGRPAPVIGHAWGRHIDQVWSPPATTRVLEWRNAARLVNGRYAQPLPSNHSPILVELQINR